MRIRTATTLVLVALPLMAGPSLAAKPKKLPKAVPMSWADPAKDANAINSQAGILPENSVATPVDDAASDILGVTINRVDDGFKVTGIRVTLKLSAAPRASVVYRVTGSVPGCSTFWFQYANYVDTPTAALRNNCTPSGSPTSAVSATVNGPVTAAIQGNSIVWTLRTKELPDGVKVGTVYSPLQAESRAIFGASVTSVTAPVLDETAVQTKKYTLGQ